jgi:hypothetical protein
MRMFKIKTRQQVKNIRTKRMTKKECRDPGKLKLFLTVVRPLFSSKERMPENEKVT